MRYDKKNQRWYASGRENGKSMFLGYYDTYDEAKQARENWEGDNVFYKKGSDENFSDLKGKEITRRPKGKGTITYRKDNKKWRVVLRNEGTTILDKQFSAKEEAEQYLNDYLSLL